MPPSSQKLENMAIENKMCLEAKECNALFFSAEMKTIKIRDPPLHFVFQTFNKELLSINYRYPSLQCKRDITSWKIIKTVVTLQFWTSRLSRCQTSLFSVYSELTSAADEATLVEKLMYR